MRGSHPGSHVTNEKRYVSIFTRPMDTKLSRVVTQDKGTFRSRGHVANKKALYLHFHNAEETQT